jgi:hypothetical protein
MPSYNALRRAYGLAPKTSFTAVTGEATDQYPAGSGIDDPHSIDFTALRDIHGAYLPLDSDEGAASAVRASTLAARLRGLYGDVDKLDAFTGMLAEPHVLGAEFGELQLAIWKRQFEALRDGDRFYYEHDPAIAVIERDYGISVRHTLAQVIEANTGLDVRDDVFKLDGAPAYEPRDGGVGGSVPATLSLTLGAPASFGAFAPGIGREYTASMTATVTSTAGDAALTFSDPGHLANGAFALPEPLRVDLQPASWAGPVSNGAVSVVFKQAIGALDALRTGAYARTLTFTLATTAP